MKSEKTGMPFWKNEKWKKFSSQNFGIASLRNLRKDQLLILLLVGILLMVIAVPVKNTSKNGSSETYDTGTSDESGFSISGQGNADMTAYTKNLEQRLAQLLSQIDGAGNVEVMITLKSSSEKVLDKDVESDQETTTERDSQGGTRQTSRSNKKESTIYDGSNTDESPYVSKELSPEVEGVVVLADGGGNAVVKENISGAVQALFDIEPHKIRIMKKQTS